MRNWAREFTHPKRRDRAQKLCARHSANMWQPEHLEDRKLLSGVAANAVAEQAALDLSNAVFVQNQGQWGDRSVKYAYNGQGIDIGFTNSGPVLELQRAGSGTSTVDRARIAMSFDGAKPAKPLGVDRVGTAFNYLKGDRAQHRTHVPGFEKIEYANLYAGIDLLTWGQRDGMKYEFHVGPHADWRNIRVRYSGSTGLSIGGDGSLHIATPVGEIVELAPVLYQTIKGVRSEVAGHFILTDNDTYGFAVTGKYDHSRELVIDPNLSFATYLGGSDNDYSQAIAIDSAGNSYITGYSAFTDWATGSTYNTTLKGNNDIFVAKMSNDGSSLVYVTYLGGTGNDLGTGIAIDTSGNAYVTGYTQSSGWATAGAYDTSFNGVYDAFVAKLNSSGSSLTYATYLGGANADYGYGIAVDSTGNTYVAGYTASSGWATAGAYDTTFNDGDSDAFVAKLNSTGSSLTYATYLGGSDTDYANAIAIDSTGNAYIAGQTASAGSATAGAYDTSFNGGTDAFVAKLNSSGAVLSYATYLGGSSDDSANGIAVDGSGNAYVTGATSSAGWATAGAYDTTQNGLSDAFVAKLSASGAALTYATYLGGTGDDFALGIAIDNTGSAYVTGYTGSSLWATASGNDTVSRGGYDAFLVKLSASGAVLRYAANIGGSNNDFGYGIAVDNAGDAYIAGNTFSSGWATASAYDSSQNGGSDAFVLQFTGLVDPPLFPGDTNGDGGVDFQDLVVVAQNYGGSGKIREQGDVTGDGNVDFQDLVLIAQNYGKTAPTTAMPVAAAFAPAAATTQPNAKAPSMTAAPVPVAKPVTALVNEAPAATIPVAPKPATKPTPFSTRKRATDAVLND